MTEESSQSEVVERLFDVLEDIDMDVSELISPLLFVLGSVMAQTTETFNQSFLDATKVLLVDSYYVNCGQPLLVPESANITIQ